MADVKLVVMAVMFARGFLPGGEPATVEVARLTHEVKVQDMEGCSRMSPKWSPVIEEALRGTLKDLWAERMSSDEWHIESGSVCSGPPLE